MVRPSIPLAVERVFWVHVGAGASVVAAAGLSGVSRASGQRLFAASGGVRPSRARAAARTAGHGVSYARLSLDERHQIAAMRKAKLSIRKIAAELGRRPS